jgi:hypothetical protein
MAFALEKAPTDGVIVLLKEAGHDVASIPEYFVPS